MYRAFVALCFFGSALAACKPSLTGCCPKVTTLKNFDAHRYTGLWYEQRTYRPNDNYPYKCAIREYALDENKTLTQSHSRISRIGSPSTENETSHIPNVAEPAKLKFERVGGPKHESDYWILGTDYDSYALFYECKGLKGYCEVYATILTRDPTPPESVIAEALNVAKKNNLNASKFRSTKSILCHKEFVDVPCLSNDWN